MYKTKDYECYSIPELLNEYTENRIQIEVSNHLVLEKAIVVKIES